MVGTSVNEDAAVQEGNSCEEIHLAMVVSGYQTIRRVVVVVKSILFYTHNPIHLHLLVDAPSESILSTIFKTWQLPVVNVSFYSLSVATKAVEWIPNTHYSGIYGLSKLTLASVLPSSLKAVIVLDTDLMLAADIKELWGFSTHLRKARKQLGLVENQSDWYLGNMWKGHKPWPALGRGFNTGVVVLNLELMRELNWNETWHSAARNTLVTHAMVALADQDVINAAIVHDRGLVFILPCVWNVQLSENTLSDYCFKSAHHFKVIHWNSAAKLDVSNIYAPHFKNLFRMFEDYDSMLFRTHLSDCNSKTSPFPVLNQQNEPDPCLDVRQEAWLVPKVHPYYLNYSYKGVDDFDVTLVAQMSMDRLHMLEPLCEQWAGPLSITLYATDADLRELRALVAASHVLKTTSKLALHVVFKCGKLYPVNRLRNIALNSVSTPYVFLSDADFIPMPSLYHYAREAIRVLGTKRRALIVPAFESLLYRVEIPKNKTQLNSMLESGTIFTFRQHVWNRGHAPTNFEHWRKTKKPYRVKWAEDFEPYFIVNHNVTRYDERFVGFGWNKVSHVMELAAQDYELVVLPEAYMVHMPHAPSADIVGYRRSRHYRDCMQVLKREFRKELEQKYRWEGKNQ
jgi:glycosyltransferase-like protein LARGE